MHSLIGHAALMEALAETTFATSDAELVEECHLAGEDPAGVAAATRMVLLTAAKDFRQRHLRAAASQYKKRIAEMGTRWVDLPDAPSERRTLLASLFAVHPGMQSAYLTIQHRDFKELSDADVESCLIQLAELGLLDQQDQDHLRRGLDPVDGKSDEGKGE